MVKLYAIRLANGRFLEDGNGDIFVSDYDNAMSHLADGNYDGILVEYDPDTKFCSECGIDLSEEEISDGLDVCYGCDLKRESNERPHPDDMAACY